MQKMAGSSSGSEYDEEYEEGECDKQVLEDCLVAEIDP